MEGKEPGLHPGGVERGGFGKGVGPQINRSEMCSGEGILKSDFLTLQGCQCL